MIKRVVVLAGEPRRRDGRGLDGFDRATQTDALDEIAASDFERLRPRVGLWLGRSRIQIEAGRPQRRRAHTQR